MLYLAISGILPFKTYCNVKNEFVKKILHIKKLYLRKKFLKQWNYFSLLKKYKFSLFEMAENAQHIEH